MWATPAHQPSPRDAHRRLWLIAEAVLLRACRDARGPRLRHRRVRALRPCSLAWADGNQTVGELAGWPLASCCPGRACVRQGIGHRKARTVREPERSVEQPEVDRVCKRSVAGVVAVHVVADLVR